MSTPAREKPTDPNLPSRLDMIPVDKGIHFDPKVIVHAPRARRAGRRTRLTDRTPLLAGGVVLDANGGS